MYGEPAGSRSDARASSLICAGAAASAACSAALAAAALSARACSAAAFFAAGPLVSGVSMRSLEQRPLLAVRQAGAGAGLARPMATGDSVSEAPMAGNPKANENIRLGDGGALGGAVVADDKGAKTFGGCVNQFTTLYRPGNSVNGECARSSA